MSYLEYDVTLIDKTSTLSYFSNNENLAISFSLSGNIGATGATGQAGAIGATGPSGAMVSGTLGQTLYHNGTLWSATSNLYHDNTNIGVGTTSPLAKLHIDKSGNEVLRLEGLYPYLSLYSGATKRGNYAKYID